MVSIDTVGLDRIDVIHAGRHGFRMHETVRAVPIRELPEALKPLPRGASIPLPARA